MNEQSLRSLAQLGLVQGQPWTPMVLSQGKRNKDVHDIKTSQSDKLAMLLKHNDRSKSAISDNSQNTLPLSSYKPPKENVTVQLIGNSKDKRQSSCEWDSSLTQFQDFFTEACRIALAVKCCILNLF
ncbi:unnamed protein product [Ilex paraguariensis]|uniref:Uncharacterized protein n=1 Tax=Ilex paraguariensis TaxID=185542 RepID=A0ABC8V2J6_9AQUA